MALCDRVRKGCTKRNFDALDGIEEKQAKLSVKNIPVKDSAKPNRFAKLMSIYAVTAFLEG